MSRKPEQWYILVSGSRFQSQISKLTHYLYRGALLDFKMERKVIKRPPVTMENSFCWFLWAVPGGPRALITNLCGSICWHPRGLLMSQSSARRLTERVLSPVWKIQIIRGQNSSLWRFSPAHAAITLSMLHCAGPSQGHWLQSIKISF